MVQLLVKAALGIFAKAASAEVAEWLLFKVADVLVKKTDTKHDDEFLEKIKEANAKASEK